MKRLKITSHLNNHSTLNKPLTLIYIYHTDVYWVVCEYSGYPLSLFTLPGNVCGVTVSMTVHSGSLILFSFFPLEPLVQGQ